MEEKLKKLLKEISDSYDDFVYAIMLFCKTDEEREAMIDYISGNKNVTSSDVLDFYYDEVKPKRNQAQR